MWAIGSIDKPQRRARAARGFSILELLVALAIAAALTGVALLASGAGVAERRGEQEMQRLNATMQLVCDRAVIEGRILGFGVAGNAYQPYELAVDGWRPMIGEGVYRSQSLPEQWRLRLALEGSLADLAATLPAEPQLVCMPDGQSTPFRLALLGADGEAAWNLEGNGAQRRRLRSAQQS